MFGVLINVGSNSSNPNGRGRVFKNGAFEYLPIPEERRTVEEVATYRDLGFARVKYPDLEVHLDPEFETFTYGHVSRGFGDMQNLVKLGKDDVLFFLATLQKEDTWAPYIIGFFQTLEIHDCRGMSVEDVLVFRHKGFANNAHLKRLQPRVDLLIKGGEGSRLLKKAFPLVDESNHLVVAKSLENLILTATGKKIKPGTPWFRWTLTCKDCHQLLRMKCE